jgi:uncharacterized protein YeaO (DUF488 family)
MIKETCLTLLKEEFLKNPDAKSYICLRNPPDDIHYETGKIVKCVLLSPSKNLTRDFQGKLINWTGFISKFYTEMSSPKREKLMRSIKLESAEYDVYLVCSYDPNESCHGSILIDLIDNA